MNINFRAQPQPELIHTGTPRPGPNEVSYGKTSYFVCRHSPHPKTVCHIKGLNDTPVCVVKDRGPNDGRFGDFGLEQSLRHAGIPTDTSLPSNALPSLVQTPPRANVAQLMRDEIADLKKRAGNTPLLKRKDDPLRKYLGDREQSRIPLELSPLSPARVMRYRPDTVENINYLPTYLDQEMKVLEKLRDILQTDSLAEILKWLSRASLKEKEFVSNFIRSDVTTRDLLNYQQKELTENEAENLNLRAMLKSQKAAEKGSPKDNKRLRPSSKGTVSSKGEKLERERGNLLTRKEKIRIPTSDSSSVQHFPSKASVHESNPHTPALSQTSSQVIYNKARDKRSHPSSKGEGRF